MEEKVSSNRYEKLGFKPQKENVYNKLLPYNEQLEEESMKLYKEIKTNLLKSVMAREMRPGCALWTSRLNKYMKIYGLKFSKEDHIGYIRLFYDILTTPNLEPTRINKCIATLTQLLKKKYLISRDDLQLDWRPLYNLCDRVIERSKSDIGMYRCFSTLESTIMNVIRLCRIYFPASATQEILKEFRPQLCALNVTDIASAIEYLDVFLPVCVKPEEADISYKLWFKDFMEIWDNCHNLTSGEEHMMWLMARLSGFAMGYIDWEPYIPLMFARFTRSLQLPVYFHNKPTGKHYKLHISSIAIWICCSLNGDKNSTFFHLEKFMQSLVSYYYPANVGRWTVKLRELLRKLSYYFIQRVHCERFKKPSWETPIPDSFKLTDADIDRFVNILKPCLEQAMFSRQGSQDVSLSLQYLASLRPTLIIPMTLDKLYASMDSLTEPHKLISSMMGVTAVARYMVQGKRNDYPEGFTHVYPLLMALLPGIDPNDIRKCLVTFNFMVHFINMIPLINSSEAAKYYDLTEEEHIVCEASAGFEDFALQFFDKLLLWIESNSVDFIRLEQAANSRNNNKNRVEVLAESTLISVITSILHQCSPEIFTETLKKVYHAVVDKIMEINVSGKMIAIICQGFAKVNPKETLKLFIPYLCETIEKLLDENPNINKEEHLDDELLYNLQILSEIVDARSEILEYSDRLTNILDRTIHMTSLVGSQLSSRILDVMLASLTHCIPTEFRSSSTSYSTALKDFLSIREWGKPQKLSDLKLSWYVPGQKEIDYVKILLNKYLVPELDKLNNYANGIINLSRDELRRSLKIVESALSSHQVLPIWDEPPIQLVESVLDPWAFNLIVSGDITINLDDGRNIRKVIADTIHNLQHKILETDEGDTKSLQLIVLIYNILVFNKSRFQDFEYHWKNFQIVKKLLEDRLHQNKLHLRHILISRVVFQQEFRIQSRTCSFTETHKQILLDLFELSVSRYSATRIAAQAKLISVVSYFAYSYTVLTPKLLEILQMDSETHHEKFKGCLYILISPKNSPIVARHDWSFIRQLWPLIVRSMPSEKPSIVNLINNVAEAVYRYFPTIAINFTFSQETLNSAINLSRTHPICDLNEFQKYIDMGEQNLKLKCEKRLEDYNLTVEALLDACINGNLHWRYHEIAVGFLKHLVHNDVKYSVKAVDYFLQLTIHESITVRKKALRSTVFALIQNKPKFKKTELNIQLTENIETGIRSDNEWLLYNSRTIPKNEQEWEKPRFIHDNCSGFYAWPEKLSIYVPTDLQPNVDKRTLTEVETTIFNFFNNTSNIKKLVKYFSLEEKKGKDQFNIYKFLLFKELFKIFEDRLLDKFLPHLAELVEDKQESSQRCAAEIISGLIRGTKHWKYEKVEHLWHELIPILQTVILNTSNETITDWGVAMAMALEKRDPNRHHWLLEFLIDDPLSDQTSMVACGRLYMLQCAICQQSWRNVELHSRLLQYFKPHLSHSFQNIRDKIGCTLISVFAKDIIYRNSKNSINGPMIKQFFDELKPIFTDLYNFSLTKKSEDDTNGVELLILSEEKHQESIKIFKLICKFIIQAILRINFTTLPEYFDLLSLASIFQSNESDDEMKPICTTYLAVISQTITTAKYMPYAINEIRNVIGCSFWSARSIITEFMSTFVFHNLPIIISNKEWVLEFQTMVLTLIEDPQPEVRINASQLLSGLLHCEFIPNPNELLSIFIQKAKTKVKKNNLGGTFNQQNNSIRYRHGGVLGLCAFISANPYDVPEYLPKIFGHLGAHLNDPQPIPTTIRKTMGDFKRTHHENWQMYKLKFTEEELLVLSDLTVPPSYYV